MSNIKDFIGVKTKYDKDGQVIWGVDKKGGYQMLLNVRGYGAIQNLFKNKKGHIDFKKADAFQDELGEFISNAINEKLGK